MFWTIKRTFNEIRSHIRWELLSRPGTFVEMIISVPGFYFFFKIKPQYYLSGTISTENTFLIRGKMLIVILNSLWALQEKKKRQLFILQHVQQIWYCHQEVSKALISNWSLFRNISTDRQNNAAMCNHWYKIWSERDTYIGRKNHVVLNKLTWNMLEITWIQVKALRLIFKMKSKDK